MLIRGVFGEGWGASGFEEGGFADLTLDVFCAFVLFFGEMCQLALHPLNLRPPVFQNSGRLREMFPCSFHAIKREAISAGKISKDEK